MSEDRAAAFRDHIVRALRIADEATVELIESEGIQQPSTSAVRWYDTAPLLNANEYPSELLDMHAETIRYGIERRLLERHPSTADLVRVTRRPR